MSKKLLILSALLACASSLAAQEQPENLIDRIIDKPDSHTVGQWIIGANKVNVNEKTQILGKELLEKNACVKVTVVRDQQGALWAQQVTLLPIKSQEVCDAEALKTVEGSGLAIPGNPQSKN